MALAPASTFAVGRIQDLASIAITPNKKLKNSKLPPSQNHSHHPPLIPSFPLKRMHEVRQHQNADLPLKIHQTRRPPKWTPPHSSQEKTMEGGVNELKRARPKTFIPEPSEPLTKVSPSHKTGIVLGVLKDPYAPKQTCQIQQTKVEERSCESAVNAKQTPSSVACKRKHKLAKCGPDKGPKTSHEAANGGDPQNQSKAGCLTATLTSDPRVKDSGKLNQDEKMQVLEKAGKAKALVLTLVYRDGTTQLDPEQVSRAGRQVRSFHTLNIHR